ncbi:hypothetical protein HY387_01540 [Candidatus Daviesbacteria bacterium]|nr:hypothetical protein [Candidatus Daviesbacteria bacterium]
MGAIEDAERHAQIADSRYRFSHPSSGLPILGFIADLQAVAKEIRAHHRAGEPIEPPVNLPRLLKIEEIREKIHRLVAGELPSSNLPQSQLIIGGVSFIASYGLVSLIVDLNRAIKNSD